LSTVKVAGLGERQESEDFLEWGPKQTLALAVCGLCMPVVSYALRLALAAGTCSRYGAYHWEVMLSIDPLALMNVADPRPQLEHLYDTLMARHIDICSRDVAAVLGVWPTHMYQLNEP
jgi:hypothetical protein